MRLFGWDDVEDASERWHSVLTIRVAQTQSLGASLELESLRQHFNLKVVYVKSK